MKRALIVTIIALMLMVPLASAAGWLQPRGDAAATGFQPAEGPAWPEVALDVQLSGSMKAEADAPPLILEDQVLVLARPYGDPADTDYRVLSVDTRTGNVTLVADDIEVAGRLSMATDGRTLYVSSRGTVHAFPLGPGGSEWTWTGVGRFAGTGEASWRMEWCNRMTLKPGNLTVLCEAERIDQAPYDHVPARSGSLLGSVVVARLNSETGEETWNWTVPRDPREREPGGGSYAEGLAVGDDRVIVQTREGGVSCNTCEDGGTADWWTGEFNSDLWALHAGTGSLDWHKRLQSANQTRAWVAGERTAVEDETFGPQGNPAIADGAVYAKAGNVHKLNLGDGGLLWSQRIGEEDVDPRAGGGTGIALNDHSVLTTSAQTVYRIDKTRPEDGWSTSLNFSARQGFQEEPVASPSVFYTATVSPSEPDAIYAFETGDGNERWHHTTTGEINAFSVGEGLLAYTDVVYHDDTATTTVGVLGRTNASPTANADPSTVYPQPGEAVEVNLSASEAGTQGPVTRYKAIWGDGTESPWQVSPVLNHTYDEAGDVEARFLAGNDEGQTASTTHTFHVGQEPPQDPTFLQTAFARENQEMTFGVLGIAMALGGGLIGVARRYRKRTRLQDELAAVEKAYEETRHNPVECEAQLTERKTHARGLLLDGELEEQQFQVVEKRVEELLQELRKRSLGDEFDFLPHGLVKRGREMLEDGKVSTLEAEAFLRALEEDEMLTGEQEALVRERILAWRRRDAGGDGA